MNHQAWLDQVTEPPLEPDLPIIDAHHHIWSTSPAPSWEPYHADDLMQEITQAGHKVIGTVYTDSHANYRTEGPQILRVVGETEFVDAVAEESNRRGPVRGVAAAIVSHVDLTLGASAGEVLDAHVAASKRFRGIRHMTAFDPDLPPIYGATEPGIMGRPEFREGFKELARRDLTFDAWVFQPQLLELVDLIQAFPETRITVDHVGGPLGVGRFAGKRDEAFAQWKSGMAEIAKHDNVVVKLGGLNMSPSGMDATDKDRPHTSEESAAIQRDHLLTTIDLFGADRCMFESNFPVDKRSISYNLVWNTFKRVTADLSASDREMLFSGTAKRVYKPDLPA